MKKVIGTLVAILAVLAVAGAAVAHWDGTGRGFGYRGVGPEGASTETIKKFRKETVNLREEMAAKRLDLRAEYDKESPDRAKIASLRKDLIDIEAKIDAIAEKNGMTGWRRGPRMRGPGAFGCGGPGGPRNNCGNCL